jgi:hypothetical protein
VRILINLGIILGYRPWDYYCLSQNLSITWEIVKENPDRPWDYYCLSRNPNITWEIVKENPDRPWDYYCLSKNPNITWEIVKENPDRPWDYCYLSRNEFLYNNTVCKREYKKAVEKRRGIVEPVLKTILYKDLSGEVLKYVGYD